jgi:S1-C subfamily serine protease
MDVLESHLDTGSEEFKANAAHHRALASPEPSFKSAQFGAHTNHELRTSAAAKESLMTTLGSAISRAAVFALFLVVAPSAYCEDKLPTPSMFPISGRTDAIDKHLKGRSLSVIEGIWLADNSSTEVAIVPATPEFSDHCDFVAAITSTKNKKWKIGEVKMLLTESATPGLYSVIYVSDWRQIKRTWVSIGTEGLLSIREDYAHDYVKLYPKSSDARTQQQPAASGGRVAGSGFMLSLSAVVTSYHVIREASKIEVVVGPLRIPARLLLQDERNDLAILQLQPNDTTVAGMVRSNTACLPVRDDAPSSGERVFALGYPLSDLINTDMVITEGLISSATGPNGDTGVLQTSASIQPGSSGGPLVDQYGRVVGVVAASANSAAVYRATGSLPQNINFAISAVPLRAMTKFLAGVDCPKAQEKTMDGQSIKNRCAAAVVRIEAR